MKNKTDYSEIFFLVLGFSIIVLGIVSLFIK